MKDNAPPLNIEIVSSEEHPDGKMTDLSFDCRKGVRIKAHWIEPSSPPLWPAVLLVHPSPGDRYFFIDEAWELARNGIGSLLIEAPWSEGAWSESLTLPDDAIKRITIGFRKVQRGIELMWSLEDVDHESMGYIGMGMGALIGGIVVSVDHRLKAAVLMSGVGSFTDVASLNLPDLKGEALERYRTVMSPIDPVNYIGSATPTQLLFQYGNQDHYPRDKLVAFAEAGSEPKTIMEYDAGHLLNEVAREEAVSWLMERLRN